MFSNQNDNQDTKSQYKLFKVSKKGWATALVTTTTMGVMGTGLFSVNNQSLAKADSIPANVTAQQETSDNKFDVSSLTPATDATNTSTNNTTDAASNNTDPKKTTSTEQNTTDAATTTDTNKADTTSTDNKAVSSKTSEELATATPDLAASATTPSDNANTSTTNTNTNTNSNPVANTDSTTQPTTTSAPQTTAAPTTAATNQPAVTQPTTAASAPQTSTVTSQPSAATQATTTTSQRSANVTLAAQPTTTSASSQQDTIPQDAQTAINVAKRYVGQPYVWGGSNPRTGFDCSGLVQYAYGQAGVPLHRVSQDQWNYDVNRISQSEAKPGDLIFFSGTYDAPGMTHVGIYLGNGMMIDAQTRGVLIEPISDFNGYPRYFGRIKGSEYARGLGQDATPYTDFGSNDTSKDVNNLHNDYYVDVAGNKIAVPNFVAPLTIMQKYGDEISLGNAPTVINENPTLLNSANNFAAVSAAANTTPVTTAATSDNVTDNTTTPASTTDVATSTTTPAPITATNNAVNNSTVSADTTAVSATNTNSTAATNVTAGNVTANHSQANELPQTGQSENNVYVALGLSLLSMSAMTYGFTKKKKIKI